MLRVDQRGRQLLDPHLHLAFHCGCNAFHNLFKSLDNFISNLRIKGADRAFHGHFLWDDIESRAAVDDRKADHRSFQRSDIARDDGLRCRDDLRGANHRVNRLREALRHVRLCR